MITDRKHRTHGFHVNLSRKSVRFKQLISLNGIRSPTKCEDRKNTMSKNVWDERNSKLQPSVISD